MSLHILSEFCFKKTMLEISLKNVSKRLTTLCTAVTLFLIEEIDSIVRLNPNMPTISDAQIPNIPNLSCVHNRPQPTTPNLSYVRNRRYRTNRTSRSFLMFETECTEDYLLYCLTKYSQHESLQHCLLAALSVTHRVGFLRDMI